MKNIGRLTTLSMAFMFALPHAAHAQTVAQPPVPASLEVPAPNEAFLLGRGRLVVSRPPRETPRTDSCG
jgi:hypothetical protein